MIFIVPIIIRVTLFDQSREQTIIARTKVLSIANKNFIRSIASYLSDCDRRMLLTFHNSYALNDIFRSSL